MIKKILISIFLCFLFCSHITGGEFIKYSTDAPSVILELNNQKAIFLIDTGSKVSLIPLRTIKKLNLDKTSLFIEFNNYSYDKKRHQEDAKELEQLIGSMFGINTENNEAPKKYIPNKKYVPSFKNIHIGSEMLKELKLTYIELYDEKKDRFVINDENIDAVLSYDETKEDNYDGILGLDVISQFRNITVDYRRKRIAFNSNYEFKTEPIRVLYEIPNEYNVQLYDNRFFIPLTIENNLIFGLLDTGNRSDYIILPVKLKNVLKTDTDFIDSFFTVNIDFANKIKEKLAALYFDSKYVISLYEDEILNSFGVSLIGSGLFSKHIIQFDFENDMFRME